MREKHLERERKQTRVDVRTAGTGCVQGVDKGNEQPAASDWNEVGRRRTEQPRHRTDVARNYQYYEKEKKMISYFFTNFPDNFMAKHMLKAFLKYGDFEEVVIPAKRDRRGKRFGFARAVGVEDPENFAIKLDNIIIGCEKILVNLPRFDRQGKEQYVAAKPTGVRRNSEMEHKRGVVGKHIQETPTTLHPNPQTKLSYSDPVKTKPQTANPNTTVPLNQKPPPNSTLTKTDPHRSYPKTRLNHRQFNQRKRLGYVPPPRPKKPWAHRTFEIEEEQVQKFNSTYVGVVNRPGLSYRMHEEFAQEGYFNVKTTPMRANLVLLESLEEGELKH